MPENNSGYFKMILGFFIFFDLVIWCFILFPADLVDGGLGLYFLNVGQGDSSLAVLPRSTGSFGFAQDKSGQAGGVKILIDGGPINGLLQKNLEGILPISDRYIDLIVVSHPQIDHFGGLIEVVKNYKIGAIIIGDSGQNAAWQEFEKEINDQGVRIIKLFGGDRIHYENSSLDILFPFKSVGIGSVNDQSLAMILNSGGIKAFFGGDLSAEAEKEIADAYDIDVDILKVSHHGSKFSSDLEFLKEASPLVSIIEVGKNSYGHPTREALDRLKEISSQIFRTDLNGLIKITAENGELKIFSQD